MSHSQPASFRYLLPVLRIAIGWHFLYEGLVKLIYAGWSSAGFLQASTGPLAGVFRAIGGNSVAVTVVDFLNIWGLIAVGLGLMLGVLTRWASVGGMVLLGLYYLANPPLFGLPVAGSDGSYLIVNRNLIEMLTLGFFVAWRPVVDEVAQASRREMLAAAAGLPVMGAFLLAVLRKHGYRSFEEMNLRMRGPGPNRVVANPTIRSFQFAKVGDLRARPPMAQIGKVQFSRLILGGNLIGGWAHARDLIYVSKLVKAYHHRDKVFETFALAESCGVNAILTNPMLCETINDYWRNGGRIKFISDCGGKNVLEMIQRSIDKGAAACYIQGAVTDQLVKDGNYDLIAKGLELIRKNGIPAGIGAHELATVKGVVGRGLAPDFWMKTLHECNYWSARKDQQHDNIWCTEPEDTVAFMKERPEPWIAFKVLAAGAIDPKRGFRYALESGADFLCVGMYDFQVVDDVNLFCDVLNKGLVRGREWRA
ncbi:MAG: DoxX family protein [Acidobacteria bacterium]|nr:DoxX family protein [Acidobacteriota bacterium]